MKTKRLLPFVLTLLVVLACSTVAFPAPQPTAMPAIPTLQSTQAQPISQVVTLASVPFSEEGQTPPYKITAQIPNLTGSDDPRLSAFNSLLHDLVMGEIDAFRKDVLQNASNPPITGGSSFDVQYSVIGQAETLWSLKLEIMGYSDGAAHPYHYSITVNYDLEQGREIMLDEIFLPNSDYLQRISDYCKAQLATRDIAFDMFAQGADPLPENYQRWNLSRDGLVITFDEYQVAPYAAGPQIVVIPFGELEVMINRQGPAAPFLP
jgi:hypothetical protein